MAVTIGTLLAGLVLLFLGRQLFWAFVGIVGFFGGLFLASALFGDLPTWALFVIAIVIGILGAGLAILAQRLLVILSGFLAAGIFFLNLFSAAGGTGVGGNEFGWLAWLVFLCGGILGAVIVAIAFDWALIVLSSLFGADLLVGVAGAQFDLDTLIRSLLFVVLVILGILVQSILMRGSGGSGRPMRASN